MTTVDRRDANDAGSGGAAYVYGVVAAGAAPTIGAAGVGGGAVGTVAFEDVAALVSAVETPIRAKRRELLSHTEVLNEVVKTTTVVPLRFGTTFRDADAVLGDLLEPRRRELSRLLREFDGCVELLVKGFYREEAVLADLVRGDARIRKLRALTRERPPEATHAERLELGTLVAAALEARTRADAAAILEKLRPLALDVRVDDAPVENQVLRASLLVERTRVEEVDAAMNALAAEHARTIVFTYVGPLAPHSFVKLEEVAWAS